MDPDNEQIQYRTKQVFLGAIKHIIDRYRPGGSNRVSFLAGLNGLGTNMGMTG